MATETDLELTYHGTTSLGCLINALKRVTRTNCKGEPVPVYFDFCRQDALAEIDSYRGSYDHLAIGWGNIFPKKTSVSALIAALELCVGKEFEGYKGGDYTMNRDTPVWCANWSEAGSTAIVGVYDGEYQIVLRTRYVP